MLSLFLPPILFSVPLLFRPLSLYSLSLPFFSLLSLIPPLFFTLAAMIVLYEYVMLSSNMNSYVHAHVLLTFTWEQSVCLVTLPFQLPRAI